MPETPKVIRDETNLLFFWESHGTKNYFKSVTHPMLFIATKQERPVHMARGQPSITDFEIIGKQPWLKSAYLWSADSRMYHVHEGVKSFI